MATQANTVSVEAMRRWFEWRENPDTACNCDHCQYLMFGARYYAPGFKDSYKDADRAWGNWEARAALAEAEAHHD